MHQGLNIYHRLFEFVIEARASVRLYVGIGVDLRQLHEQCMPLLKRHVSIDILCSEPCFRIIAQDAVLLSLFHQFKTHGGNVFQVSDRAELLVCEVDFRRALQFRMDETGEFAAGIAEAPLQSGEWMDEYTEASREILTQQGDILLWAAIDKTHLFQHQQVVFNWEVSNADSLEISGFGEVSMTGQQPLRILEDTIITVRARNRHQVKSRSFFIPAVKRTELQYQLQFFNVASKQFEDLDMPAGSDVFGVMKGSRLKLCWDVRTDGTVEILPFGLSEKSGAHEFTLKDYLQITIIADALGRALEKIIHVKEFPVPVFEQEFISIDEQYLQSTTFSVTDLHEQAYQYIADKGMMTSEYASAALEASRKEEGALLERFQSLDFSTFYQENSIPKLKLSVKERLLRYFKENTAVTRLIKNIKDYYE